MNLYFNLVLVCLTILIIVLCNTEYFLVDENDKSKKIRKLIGKKQARLKCDPLKNDPNFPSTHDDIYNSNMLYKYYTNGMFSNLQSIYKTPEEIKENSRFKNKPIINNPDYLVGASNEGSSALKTCEPCTYEKNAEACFDNIQIMEDDYCPKILQCNGMSEIPNSKTLQNPNFMNNNIQTITKQLERLSKLKNKNKLQDDKNECDKILCYIKNNPDIQVRYTEFNNIYKQINSKINNSKTQIGLITLDFLNNSDENILKMKQFLIDPLNIYYFDLPGVSYTVKMNGVTLQSQNKADILTRSLVSESLIKRGFENIGNSVKEGKYNVKIEQQKDISSFLLDLCLNRMVTFSNEVQSCSRYINNFDC